MPTGDVTHSPAPLRPRVVAGQPLEPAGPGAESPGYPLHRPGHPVAGVGVFDITDANIVLASSWAILCADGSFSSKKRYRAADILDRRLLLIQVAAHYVLSRSFVGQTLMPKKICWLFSLRHGQQEVDHAALIQDGSSRRAAELPKKTTTWR